MALLEKRGEAVMHLFQLVERVPLDDTSVHWWFLEIGRRIASAVRSAVLGTAASRGGNRPPGRAYANSVPVSLRCVNREKSIIDEMPGPDSCDDFFPAVSQVFPGKAQRVVLGRRFAGFFGGFAQSRRDAERKERTTGSVVPRCHRQWLYGPGRSSDRGDQHPPYA